MACREATDGDVALGDKESVKRFLKSLRIHAPVGPRKQLVPNYHDVAALYQEAWDFGPNEALCEGHLKEKLIILLMVDTAARPSDIHRLFRTLTGRNAQIRFEGKDLFILLVQRSRPRFFTIQFDKYLLFEVGQDSRHVASHHRHRGNNAYILAEDFRSRALRHGPYSGTANFSPAINLCTLRTRTTPAL